jgi:hypothetical protein
MDIDDVDLDEFIRQAQFDFQWRHLCLKHQAEAGPGGPLYYPTVAMQGWLRGVIRSLDRQEISTKECLKRIREMAND